MELSAPVKTETGLLLQVASSFTCTPIESSLRTALLNAGIGDEVGFVQYSQMSTYMLAPPQDFDLILGTVVLLRVEDWLRDNLKSSSPEQAAGAGQKIRESLRERVEDFAGQITALSDHGKHVWFMACPSIGWISDRHKLGGLFQTYTNLVVARVQKLSRVTPLKWSAELLKTEFSDHNADRLGQIPFTQEAFDRLGDFLGRQISRTLLRTGVAAPASRPTGSAELAKYLEGLRLQVQISPVAADDRADIDRILRTAAGFSLTGERRDISEAEIDRLLQAGNCMLIRVSDRLSDYGPSGLVVFRPTDDALVVELMALSCAVLGKQVEYAVLSALTQLATEQHLARTVFEYRPTARNQSMLDFLKSLTDSVSESRYILASDVAESRIRSVATNPGAWAVKLNRVLTGSRV
ncbi:MAG: hypothetical protein NVSMB58_28780 [Terriglobales bacterium]